MITAQRARRGGWHHLLRRASSPDREDRQIALIRAYAWVEHALDAANVWGPKRPIASRILRTFRNAELSAGLDEKRVRTAIRARHQAGHEDSVPDEAACVEALKTLRDVWHALSRTFVSLHTAVELGKKILGKDHVLAVCVYGSMARGESQPNDIDLLVLDDGWYSCEFGSLYADGDFDSFERTKDALICLDIRDPSLEAAAKCRWLDILVMDGLRFGRDRDYTQGVKVAQPDPWFFENIALDLKELDTATGTLAEAKVYPFADVKRILQELKAFGLR